MSSSEPAERVAGKARCMSDRGALPWAAAARLNAALEVQLGRRRARLLLELRAKRGVTRHAGEALERLDGVAATREGVLYALVQRLDSLEARGDEARRLLRGRGSTIARLAGRAAATGQIATGMAAELGEREPQRSLVERKVVAAAASAERVASGARIAQVRASGMLQEAKSAARAAVQSSATVAEAVRAHERARERLTRAELELRAQAAQADSARELADEARASLFEVEAQLLELRKTVGTARARLQGAGAECARTQREASRAEAELAECEHVGRGRARRLAELLADGADLLAITSRVRQELTRRMYTLQALEGALGGRRDLLSQLAARAGAAQHELRRESAQTTRLGEQLRAMAAEEPRTQAHGGAVSDTQLGEEHRVRLDRAIDRHTSALRVAVRRRHGAEAEAEAWRLRLERLCTDTCVAAERVRERRVERDEAVGKVGEQGGREAELEQQAQRTSTSLRTAEDKAAGARARLDRYVWEEQRAVAVVDDGSRRVAELLHARDEAHARLAEGFAEEEALERELGRLAAQSAALEVARAAGSERRNALRATLGCSVLDEEERAAELAQLGREGADLRRACERVRGVLEQLRTRSAEAREQVRTLESLGPRAAR
ncbi:hypothetical protein T492DRAFT_956398 [Pavlovales sp. CCMP2436]|nr:hypothetical protein T492DRAFT_956398 [Pavlovales sp. CCMP2436]